MLVVEKLLPLSDHAESAVVEDYYGNRNLVCNGCCKFIEAHAETAVSGDKDRSLSRSKTCADSSSKTESHGSETA